MTALKMMAFAVPGGPRAASDARARVVEKDGFVPEAARDDLLLLLTELVTNAVRHGGATTNTQIAVTVALAGERLRVTVTDYGPNFAWSGLPERRTDDGGGYGLVLVDTLARSWGIHGSQPTTVWFELALDAAPDGSPVGRSWVLAPIVRRVLKRDRQRDDGSPKASRDRSQGSEGADTGLDRR